MKDRLVEALKQSILQACAERGGSCNGTPEGLLAVNATFDPTAAVEAVLREMGECDVVLRDEGGVVHELRGAPNDIWKILVADLTR